jgi:hypothetical protein
METGTTVGASAKLTVLAGLEDGTDCAGDSTAVVEPETVLGFGVALVDGTALAFPLFFLDSSLYGFP